MISQTLVNLLPRFKISLEDYKERLSREAEAENTRMFISATKRSFKNNI